jgi:hypothetical protein
MYNAYQTIFPQYSIQDVRKWVIREQEKFYNDEINMYVFVLLNNATTYERKFFLPKFNINSEEV